MGDQASPMSFALGINALERGIAVRKATLRYGFMKIRPNSQFQRPAPSKKRVLNMERIAPFMEH